MIAVALIVLTTAVAPIDIIDEHGEWRSIDSWRGTPTLLVPMYTRCPLACPMIVAGLKRGTGESAAPVDSDRVILFSFDPRDTPADLRRFRERQHVPLAWTIASAPAPQARQLLMNSIGFRYADLSGELAHPNLTVALTPDLKVAKVLYGTSFSGRDIDDALSIARGGRDWIGQYGAFAPAILILVAILSAVYIARQRAEPIIDVIPQLRVECNPTSDHDRPKKGETECRCASTESPCSWCFFSRLRPSRSRLLGRGFEKRPGGAMSRAIRSSIPPPPIVIPVSRRALAPTMSAPRPRDAMKRGRQRDGRHRPFDFPATRRKRSR